MFDDTNPHELIKKYENYIEEWLGRTPASLGIDAYKILGIDRPFMDNYGM